MINVNYQVRICFEYGYWGISHIILLMGNRICMTNSLRNERTIMFFINRREKENICVVNAVNLYVNVIGFAQSIALKWFLCLACRAKKNISQLLMKSGQSLLQPLGLAVITLIMMNRCGIYETIICSSMRISLGCVWEYYRLVYIFLSNHREPFPVTKNILFTTTSQLTVCYSAKVGFLLL